MTTVGIDGEFASSGGKNFYWEAYGSYGDNRGFQEKYNSHNLAKLQVAMGDPAVCTATPNCVPYNFFGGQGANGRSLSGIRVSASATILKEKLDRRSSPATP